MPNGGKISIEIQNITIDETQSLEYPEMLPGQYVLTSIADSGTGMNEATRKRIFEPFFTTKPVGEGTGLGLSICKRLLNLLGGSISVESTRGEGSTFTVRLPLVLEDSRETNSPGD